MIQQMLAIWSLVPLPFLNPAWTSVRSRFMYCWSLKWRILIITLLACEMNVILQYKIWTFFGIAFLWHWNENCSFPVLWLLLSFPNLRAYWVQHFNSIYFFALIAEEGFLISSCYSLELCIQMLISFPFSFAFRFSSFHNFWGPAAVDPGKFKRETASVIRIW